ncbi:PAS domain S-box protein [Fodinibius sp. AD559]|uniref:PAS domain S-box protein n=1 Tax=Fodinibius sp. AD559 TaxID=3424179 RepID=UPI004046A51B
MSRVSQILLITDNKSDVNLIQFELDKIDIPVQLNVISKELQLKKRLKSNPPNLIICNYKQPSLPGTEALNIVRANHPYLPFILISESTGEEKAVNAILEGASDYVTKQNLSRLGPAILREMSSYKEHKKQSAQLEKTRNRYESLIQSVNGIVWEADADTFEFQYISSKAKELLGYDPKEWLSKSNFWQEHIHPDDRQQAINFCRDKTKQGIDHSFEYRMLDADNEIVWLRDYVTVITTNGEPDHLRGLMMDISKEKEAERQRDKAYKIADIGHWELDLINEEIFWSDAIKKLHEVDDDFNPDLEEAINFYKEGEHQKRITDAVEQAIQKGAPFDLELKIITAENNERWVRAVGEPEFRNGQCVRIFGSTQDITERKEIELKFRDVVEHSTNMFYRHDTDHVLSYVSPQAQEFLGYPPEEAKQRWTEFITDHPINKEGLKHTQRAIETGETQPSYSLQLKKRNGEKIWVRVNEAPLIENGETIVIVGSLTDITEQKKAEEKIKEANKKLKSAQDIAKLGYWELNLETNDIYWSDQTYKIWEFSPNKDITFDLLLERMHPEDREDFLEQDEKAINNGVPLNLEHRIVLPDGSQKWLHVIASINTRSNGRSFYEGTVQDITAEKEAERDKIETLQRISDAFFAVDEDWIVTYWNKRAEQVLGTSSEDIVGKNLWDVYDDAIELDFYTQYHKAVDEQVTVNFEEFYPGVEKWFEVSAYPSETGLSVYFRDITEQKENHEQLKQLNKELEERADELAAANEELEQFAYVASHDLQEPLRMVSSFLERLEQKYSNQLDDKAQQYINFAVDGAHRMRRIILDLLNYSRMNQNDFEREQVDLNDLLEEITKLEQTLIEENEADIIFNNLPVIKASKTPIQQVFQNLINNAVKYHSPNIKPVVTIDSKETDNYWEFSVSDNGIGIREEFQDNIFTIFQRLHTQDEYAGTGIGLSVSKKIIEKHGGEIWVESEEGEGSTFYFTVRKPV